MRSVLNVIILLAAVVAGLYIPYALTVKRQQQEIFEDTVTKRMQQITEALDRTLAEGDRACIYEGPFPYSTRESRSALGCNRCDDLYEAGLVTKSVETYEEYGQTKYDARFELTSLGQSVYSDETNPRTGGKYKARFCFGHTAVHRIVETLPPLSLGGNKFVGIKYVAKVVDPHPFLFDPRNHPLRLAVPQKGEPALYPPAITTAVIRGDGSIDIDGSFRYGKYVNQ